MSGGDAVPALRGCSLRAALEPRIADLSAQALDAFATL
jgi:hypothetical protein